jgi:predicted nucleic acid-binding protein
VKVFLDANVLFSASKSDSNIAALIHLLIQRGHAVTSDLAAEEARRNIKRKRPTWQDDLNFILSSIELVPSDSFPLAVALDEKDKPILCTAIRQKCTHLATGDKKDFKQLYDQTIEGVTIITLLQLAELATDTNS